MTLVSEMLSRLAIGAPIRFRNLTMVPLLNSAAGASPYLTLREALAEGLLEITEVSQAGSVPTLQAKNKGDRAVLILDGEELVGAKQNRIANVTILIAANATVAIPVSCVEAGRWVWKSRHFGDSKQTMHAKGRRRNIRKVSDSLGASMSYRGDQQEVWDEVADKARRMNVHSPTSALGDVYSRHDGTLDEYAKGFQPTDGQTGAIFAVNGSIRGLELLELRQYFGSVAGKIVRSYALDALERLHEPGADRIPDAAAVDAFLADVSTATETRFPGVGLGETIRLQGPSVIGSGLALGDELVHLAAFATKD